jgi:hypothetical protein
MQSMACDCRLAVISPAVSGWFPWGVVCPAGRNGRVGRDRLAERRGVSQVGEGARPPDLRRGTWPARGAGGPRGWSSRRRCSGPASVTSCSGSWRRATGSRTTRPSIRPGPRRVRSCGCACRTGGSSASRCSAASGAWITRAGSPPLYRDPSRGQGALRRRAQGCGRPGVRRGDARRGVPVPQLAAAPDDGGGARRRGRPGPDLRPRPARRGRLGEGCQPRPSAEPAALRRTGSAAAAGRGGRAACGPRTRAGTGRPAAAPARPGRRSRRARRAGRGT